MRKTVIALATLLSMTTASAEWVATTGGSIPPGAFQGGVDSGGEPLYVCRASLNGGVHPGKTRKEFNGCNIGWGGKETAVAQYEVLVAWKTTSGADIPNNAVQVGQEKEGTSLYLCRAFHKGGVHIGKTRKEFKACNIGYGGREIAVPAYEVMTEKIGVWVATSGSNIPANAWQGGQDGGGEPLYFCRAKLSGGVHPGKTRKEFKGCNLSYGGKETAVPQYEVLVAWQPTSGSNIPANAFQGGEEGGKPLYVCRAFYKNSVALGKTRSDFNACNIAYGGAEVAVPAYEVLVK